MRIMSITPSTPTNLGDELKSFWARPEGKTGKLLMIFQPAGFDEFLRELAALSEDELNDAPRVQALSEKYDIIELGGVPAR